REVQKRIGLSPASLRNAPLHGFAVACSCVADARVVRGRGVPNGRRVGQVASAATPGGRDRLGEMPVTALTEARARLRTQPRSRRGAAGAHAELGGLPARSPRTTGAAPR